MRNDNRGIGGRKAGMPFQPPRPVPGGALRGRVGSWRSSAAVTPGPQELSANLRRRSITDDFELPPMSAPNGSVRAPSPHAEGPLLALSSRGRASEAVKDAPAAKGREDRVPDLVTDPIKGRYRMGC